MISNFKYFGRALTELDIQENDIDDVSGDWLSCFPEDFASLEVLNFSSLNTDVSFDVLEDLVCRCKSLRVLKVNKNISLEQLQRLLVWTPQLIELGTGSFNQELVPRQFQMLESAFDNCKNLSTISGLWEATSQNLAALYPVSARLSFLNLSYANLQSSALAELLAHCSNLRRLWVKISLVPHLFFFEVKGIILQHLL